MAYLDYSLPETIDFSKGIESFGDALTEVMRRKQQREQFEKQQEFQREQEARKFAQAEMNNAYQNRIIDQRENRDQREFSQRQNQYKAQQAEKARKAASPQEAEAILHDTVLFDPVTGKETGRGRLTPGTIPTVGTKPEMPAPLGYDAESARGFGRTLSAPIPGLPPELRARMLAMAKTAEGDIAAQDKAEKQHMFDLADFSRREKDAEAKRPYTMSFGPDDKGVTFDFQTQRHAAKREAADMFISNLPPGLSNEDKAIAQEIHSGIISGTIEPSKAGEMFQKKSLGVMQEGGRNARGAAANQTKIDVAKINASRPRASVDIQRLNYNLKVDEAGERQFQNFIRSQGYKADVAALRDLSDTNEALKVNNSALDVTAGAQFAKKAQGAGVLTDKDYDRFWSAIGGAEARPENWFENVIDGKMGENKRRIVVEAIRHKVDAEVNRLKTIATQADKKFAGKGWYAGSRAAYFDFIPGLPEMGAAVTNKRRGPPEAAAKSKAKDASLDEAMK